MRIVLGCIVGNILRLIWNVIEWKILKRKLLLINENLGKIRGLWGKN